MGMMINDRNVGLEMVNCYAKYFDHHEAQLNSLIDKLARTNVEIKIISDVMNSLSHAKQKDKKADFANDETMKRNIAHIHRNNPTIFENLIKGVPDHLPPVDASASPLSGEQITCDHVISENLKDIHLSEIHIDVLKEDQIDIIVEGLSGQLKMYTADANEGLLKINEKYENRSQMTEASRQGVKQDGDSKESIIRKTAR